MRKILIFLCAAVLLCSCGTTSTSLYNWGGYTNNTTKYEQLSYKDYKNQSPQATCNLICVYDAMVNHPGGSRQVPPPGICAEYGYLLLQSESAAAFLEYATPEQKKLFKTTDYAVAFVELGKVMLEKEIEFYPESRQFLEPIIKKIAK